MKVQRGKRYHEERSKTIKSRYQEIEKIVSAYQRAHHPREFFIYTLEVCESPGVSESIVNTSEEAFQECLAGIPDRIPDIHASAHQKRQDKVSKLLPEGSTADALPLAVSWFKCNCGQSFHYAEAIEHSCYSYRMWSSYRTYEELTAVEPLEQVHLLCGRGGMWAMDRLTYWKEAAELTKQVIEAAGMDPEKTTPNELDDAEHRFMVFAGPGSSTMTIVGWRCLVGYPFALFLFSRVTQRERVQVTSRYDKSSGKRTPEWRIMKSEEMPEFKHPSVRLEEKDWGCLHCWTDNAAPYFNVTWASIKSHLKEKCVKHVPSILVWTLGF